MSSMTGTPGFHFFIYSSGVLPGAAAHLTQILKTAHALARRPDVRVNVEFRRMREPAEAALGRLGLSPLPNLVIRETALPPLLRPFGPKRLKLEKDGGWSAKAVQRRMRGDWLLARREGFRPVIVTRKEEFAEWLSPAARQSEVPLLLELHWLKYVDDFKKPFAQRRMRYRGSWQRGDTAFRIFSDRALLKARKSIEQNTINQAADGVLCLTRGLERRLLRMGVTRPIAWLPSGTDVPIEAPADQPAKTLDLLYAGGMQAWKGIETLISAMARVPDARLEILGDDTPERLGELRQLATETGAADRIQFAGRIPHPEVAARIRAARVCVIPSPRRGFPEARTFTSPLKLFEYAAQGAAILASDLPSMREALSHGVNAWLVRPDDPAALAEGALHLLRNPELCARLGENARVLARDYTFDRRAERIIAFAESLGGS